MTPFEAHLDRCRRCEGPENLCPSGRNFQVEQESAIAVETPVQEYKRAMAMKLEQNVARAGDASRRCRQCGTSQNAGAMFTTMASSGICDDCV